MLMRKRGIGIKRKAQRLFACLLAVLLILSAMNMGGWNVWEVKAEETTGENEATEDKNTVVATVTVGETTTSYADLQNAIDYAQTQDGCTLRVEQDISNTDYSFYYTVSVESAHFTIDLNGKNLDLSGGIWVSAGNVTIRDSSGSTYKAPYLVIDGNGEIVLRGLQTRQIYLSENSRVYLESGTTLEGVTLYDNSRVYLNDKDVKIGSITYRGDGERRFIINAVPEKQTIDVSIYIGCIDHAIMEAGSNIELKEDDFSFNWYFKYFTYSTKIVDNKLYVIAVIDEKAEITVDEADLTYTGREIKPSVKVVYNGNGIYTLTEGKDYTVTYKDNINAGTATAIVTGMGCFTGEREIAFTINKASYAPNMPGTYISASNSKEKVGDVELPSGWKWSENTDLDTALEVGTEVKATAVYDGADKGNYENESVEISVTRSECEHVAGGILYTGEGETAPTCTVAGLGHRECSVCNETIESRIIVAAAHRYSSEWTVDKAATTTETGSKSHHCTVCDAKTDITEIPKLSSGGSTGGGSSSGGSSSIGGDSAGVPVDSKEDDKKDNTTDDGSDSKTDDTTKSEPAPVGTKLKVSGTTYQVSSEKEEQPTVTYKTVSKKAKGTVTIPKSVTIDGVKYRVTAIADKAFAGNDKVTKIVIPKQIKTIGMKAFANCKNLKVIEIQSTTLTSKNIDAKTFSGIKEGTVIRVPQEKLAAYKKLFAKKGLNKKVKITAIKTNKK